MWPCHAARSKGVSPARPDVETTGAEQDLQLQCCNHSHTVILTMHKESRNTLDSAIAVQNVHKLTVQTAQVSQEPLGPIGPRLGQHWISLRAHLLVRPAPIRNAALPNALAVLPGGRGNRHLQSLGLCWHRAPSANVPRPERSAKDLIPRYSQHFVRSFWEMEET